MSADLPLGGTLDGGVHRLPVRVYYEDTDAGGIVYHANYLRFAERGRTEMLRAMGIELSALRRDDGMIFVLHSADIRYRSPARLDDLLTVETRMLELGAASVKASQQVLREGAELFGFTALLACVDGSGKPARLPVKVRDKIKTFLGEV